MPHIYIYIYIYIYIHTYIYIYTHTHNISSLRVKNIYTCLRTKLDILKTFGPSATVKNYNIRAGAILSFYILQNITLTNYAYSLNTHYYIPFHDCVCVIKRRSRLTYSLCLLFVGN